MKKILALSLIIIYILTSCPFALAEESSADTPPEENVSAELNFMEDIVGVAEGDSNEEDSLLAEYLDVLKAVYPDLLTYDDLQTYVTRADFLIMLANLTAGSGYPEYHEFKDVNSSNTALCDSLGYAVKTGLVSASDTFRPDDYITYPEMYKMAVVTTGYNMLANQSGGWPAGYISVAQRAGLAENIVGTDGSVTASDAYTLLYNVITTNFMEQTSFGSTEIYTVEKGKTILSVKYKVNIVEGIVKADDVTSLTDENGAGGQSEITIGTETFNNKTGKSFLGSNVRGYWRKNGSSKELIALKKYENKEIFVSEFTMPDSYTIEVVLSNGKTKKYSLKKSYAIILNNVASVYTDLADYAGLDNVTLHIIDNNNDNVFEVVKIYDWNYMQIGKIDPINKILFDENPASSALDLHPENTNVKIYDCYNGETELISFDKLQSGDILTYVLSTNLKSVTLFRSTAKQTGKLDEFNSSENTVFIGGKSYELTDYAKANYNNFSLGIDATIAFDATGLVVSITQTGNGYRYGFIVASGSDDIFGRDYQLKLFTQTGKMEILPVAEKVYIDNIPGTAKDFYDLEQGLADADRMVKYGINDAGEVNVIDFATSALSSLPFTESNPERDSLTLYYNDSYEKSGTGSFGSAFVADSSTLFFQIPSSLDLKNQDDYYMIKSYSNYRNGYMQVRAYDITPGSAPKAVLYFSDNKVPVIDEYTGVELFLEITEGINGEGEPCKLMKTYNNSACNTYYVDEAVDVSGLVPGDILALAIYQNEVLDVKVHYSYSTNMINVASTDKLSYNKGYVYAYGSRMIQLWNTLNINNGSVSIGDLVSVIFTDKNITFVDIYKNSDGIIYKAVARYKPVDEVREYIHTGTNADFMLVRNSSTKWIYRVIER